MPRLRGNARESLTHMSRKTAIPVSTIHDHLKQYEGIFIRRHTALLDFSKLGFNALANVLVKVGKHGKAAFLESLTKAVNVNSVFRVNNGFDFMFEVVFRGICELEDYLEKMTENFPIEAKAVYYVIYDVRREAFLSNPESVFLV